MKKTIFKFYHYLANDSLYRNSIYLMLSTGVMAVFGFFFWVINARLYSAEQVGIGIFTQAGLIKPCYKNSYISRFISYNYHFNRAGRSESDAMV